MGDKSTLEAAREYISRGLPDRISPIIAGMDNSFEINKLLAEEIRQVCEEISGKVD